MSQQDAMNRPERAAILFEQGYNCAQSSLCAYADLLDMPYEQALRLASSFGGGMGRLREVCGALTGVFMAAGLLYGYDNPEDDSTKAQHYDRIQKIGLCFQSRFGSLLCRDLLELKPGHDSPVPTTRTIEYYKERPCRMLVAEAVSILEEMRSAEFSL